MLIIRRYQSIPAKRVITDLALRDGLPREDSPTELEGMFKSVVFPQLSRTEDGVKVITRTTELEHLLNEHPDINPVRAIQRWNKNNPHAMVPESQKFEDIPVEQVAYEVKNVIMSIKLNDKKSFKEVENNSKQRVFMDMSDDGDEDMIQENELLLDTDFADEDISVTEIEYLRERVTYLIKLIHERSKVKGIHYISYLIAYDRAKENHRRNNHTGANFTIEAKHIYGSGRIVTNNRLYRMQREGTLGDRITQNIRIGKEAVDWLNHRGKIALSIDMASVLKESKEDKLYFDYGMELIVLANRLGMPLRDEEPEWYVEENIQQTVVTYLESNRDFIDKIKVYANKDTFNSIQSIDIGSYKTSNDIGTVSQKRTKYNVYDDAMNTAVKFNMYVSERVIKDRVAPLSSLELLLTCINEVEPGMNYDVTKYKSGRVNRFVSDSRGNFLIVSLRELYPTSSLDNDYYKGIVHEYGYLVMLSRDNTDTIQYIGLTEATFSYFKLKEMIDRKNNTGEDISEVYAKWVKELKWIQESV